MNELETVDIAISNMVVHNSGEDFVDAQKVLSTQRRLEVLDSSIEGIENGLEGLFRVLIHIRVSLLNILSC
ncbi:hypothetical protein ACFX13_027478 [Malus domestica]